MNAHPKEQKMHKHEVKRHNCARLKTGNKQFCNKMDKIKMTDL